MQYRVVGTNRETVLLVFGEMYRKQRITLRRRVLPEPTLPASLAEGDRIAAKKHKKHKNCSWKFVSAFVHLRFDFVFADFEPFYARSDLRHSNIQHDLVQHFPFDVAGLCYLARGFVGYLLDLVAVMSLYPLPLYLML